MSLFKQINNLLALRGRPQIEKQNGLLLFWYTFRPITNFCPTSNGIKWNQEAPNTMKSKKHRTKNHKEQPVIWANSKPFSQPNPKQNQKNTWKTMVRPQDTHIWIPQPKSEIGGILAFPFQFPSSMKKVWKGYWGFWVIKKKRSIYSEKQPNVVYVMV